MKMDVYRVVEFSTITLFGFIAFLKTIWDWTNGDAVTTIISGVLLWIIVAVIGIVYELRKEKGDKDA